jgi:DUF917 family protein
MYRQIFIPTVDEHSVTLPEAFYGLKIEVLAFPVEDNLATNSGVQLDPARFYSSIKVDFSDFNFSRDEANAR